MQVRTVRTVADLEDYELVRTIGTSLDAEYKRKAARFLTRTKELGIHDVAISFISFDKECGTSCEAVRCMMYVQKVTPWHSRWCVAHWDMAPEFQSSVYYAALFCDALCEARAPCVELALPFDVTITGWRGFESVVQEWKGLFKQAPEERFWIYRHDHNLPFPTRAVAVSVGNSYVGTSTTALTLHETKQAVARVPRSIQHELAQERKKFTGICLLLKIEHKLPADMSLFVYITTTLMPPPANAMIVPAGKEYELEIPLLSSTLPDSAMLYIDVYKPKRRAAFTGGTTLILWGQAAVSVLSLHGKGDQAVAIEPLDAKLGATQYARMHIVRGLDFSRAFSKRVEEHGDLATEYWHKWWEAFEKRPVYAKFPSGTPLTVNDLAPLVRAPEGKIPIWFVYYSINSMPVFEPDLLVANIVQIICLRDHVSPVEARQYPRGSVRATVFMARVVRFLSDMIAWTVDHPEIDTYTRPFQSPSLSVAQADCEDLAQTNLYMCKVVEATRSRELQFLRDSLSDFVPSAVVVTSRGHTGAEEKGAPKERDTLHVLCVLLPRNYAHQLANVKMTQAWHGFGVGFVPMVLESMGTVQESSRDTEYLHEPRFRMAASQSLWRGRLGQAQVLRERVWVDVVRLYISNSESIESGLRGEYFPINHQGKIGFPMAELLVGAGPGHISLHCAYAPPKELIQRLQLRFDERKNLNNVVCTKEMVQSTGRSLLRLEKEVQRAREYYAAIMPAQDDEPADEKKTQKALLGSQLLPRWRSEAEHARLMSARIQVCKGLECSIHVVLDGKK